MLLENQQKDSMSRDVNEVSDVTDIANLRTKHYIVEFHCHVKVFNCFVLEILSHHVLNQLERI